MGVWLKTVAGIWTAALFFAVGQPSSARASDEILFGSEFTFSSIRALLGENNIVRYEGTLMRALEKYAAEITRRCESGDACLSEIRYGDVDGSRQIAEVSVLFSDGFQFSVKTDANVLEFSMTPQTSRQWEAREPQIEDWVFGGMKRAGLAPQKFFGSGHVNIDKATAFGGDVRRFRDFLVDFHNHPGLAEGILEKDPFNARSISRLPEQNRRNFEKLIAAVDRGEITSIEELERRIVADVYADQGWGKSHSLNFHGNRLEVRSVRAQRSSDQFTALTELFEGRIRYLHSLRVAGKPVQLIRDVGASAGLQSFSQAHYYVRDAGLDWARFKKTLLPSYYPYPGVLSREVAYGKRIECVY